MRKRIIRVVCLSVKLASLFVVTSMLFGSLPIFSTWLDLYGFEAHAAEESKLILDNGIGVEKFGFSVAIDGEGNTIVAGSPYADNDKGVVYIFEQDHFNGTWSEVKKLTASDGDELNFFGYSVDISANGDRIVVGAYGVNTGIGAAYIFDEWVHGENWVQTQKITASDGRGGDFFGTSISISRDGNVVVVGAPNSLAGITQTGAAYVFVENNGWSKHEDERLVAADGEFNDGFGVDVAADVNGYTIVVGANRDDNANGTDAGAAYVFKWNGINWDQQGSALIASDGDDNDNYGTSVAINNHGNTVVVGAHRKNSNATEAGAAYIFKWDGSSSWIQEGPPLTASHGTQGDYFGTDVAINDDRIVVSARGVDNRRGAAYIFEQSGGWVQTDMLSASNSQPGDSFGACVDSNGNEIIVGVPYDDNKNGTDAGAAYVYVLESKDPPTKETAADFLKNGQFGMRSHLENWTMSNVAPFHDDWETFFADPEHQTAIKSFISTATLSQTIRLADFVANAAYIDYATDHDFMITIDYARTQDIIGVSEELDITLKEAGSAGNVIQEFTLNVNQEDWQTFEGIGTLPGTTPELILEIEANNPYIAVDNVQFLVADTLEQNSLCTDVSQPQLSHTGQIIMSSLNDYYNNTYSGPGDKISTKYTECNVLPDNFIIDTPDVSTAPKTDYDRFFEEVGDEILATRSRLQISTLGFQEDVVKTYLASKLRELHDSIRSDEGPYPLIQVLHSHFEASTPNDLTSEEIFDALTSQMRDIPEGQWHFYLVVRRVGAGPGHDNMTSGWNHSKIVIRDREHAIVGGHNYTEDYLHKEDEQEQKQEPLYDLSMRLSGHGARVAGDFFDVLWERAQDETATWEVCKMSHNFGSDYSCITNPIYWGATEYFPVEIVNTNRVPSLPPTPNYWGTANPPQPVHVFGAGRGIFAIETPGQDLDGYFEDYSTDYAIIAAIKNAQNSIKIAQHSLHMAHQIDSPFTNSNIVYKALIETLLKHLTLTDPGNEVENVDILISNPWSSSLDAGVVVEGLYDEASSFAKAHKNEYGWSDDQIAQQEAWRVLDCKLRVAPFNATGAFVDPQETERRNHSKFVMVDDESFYIGSQNLYPTDFLNEFSDSFMFALNDFGFIVDDGTSDSSNAQKANELYWNPVWQASKEDIVRPKMEGISRRKSDIHCGNPGLLQPDAYEVDDEYSYANDIAIDETQNHSIHYGDVGDWVDIFIPPEDVGKGYNVTVNSSRNLIIEVYDPLGFLKEGKDSIRWQAARPGSYDILIRPESSNDLGDYTITLTEEPVADISIESSDLPNAISQGETVSYTINVTNNGPGDATDVVVIDTLPDTVIFGSAVPDQGGCNEASGVITCDIGMLNSGATSSVTVTVIGNQSTSYEASIEGSSDEIDSDESNSTIGSDISVDPLIYDFENIRVGETGTTHFTISNTGSEDLEIGSIVITGIDADAFTLQNDSCSNQSIVPSGNCMVEIKFTPPEQGSYGVSVDISSNDPDEAVREITIRGKALEADIEVEPVIHNFGEHEQTSAPQTFTITSTGEVELQIGNIHVTGIDASEFAITHDGCSNQTLAPLTGNCTIDVEFAPVGVGEKLAALTVESNDPDEAEAEAGLLGTGVTPITVTPSIGSFENVNVGENSDIKNFTLENTGSNEVGLGSINIEGNDAGEYVLQNDQCSNQTLPGGGTCTFESLFSPTTEGLKTATLSIPSILILSVPMTGTGIVFPPDISIDPTSHNFGNVDIGVTSIPQTFTVSNIGNTDLEINTITLTGADATEYSIQNNNCLNQTITSSGNCTLDLVFSPTTEGTKSAAVSVQSNDPNTPIFTVSLSGTGSQPVTDSDFWITLGDYEGEQTTFYATSLDETGDGGVIMSSYDSAGYMDESIITRFDRYGNVLWAKKILLGQQSVMDRINSIIATSDAGYAMVGKTNSDHFVAKLDTNGDLVWAKVIEGTAGLDTNNSENALAILETADGDFIVAGNTQSSTIGAALAVIKLDSTGNIVWSREIGESGKSEYVKSLSAVTGGYILTGHRIDHSNGRFASFLMKIDTHGSLLWAKFNQSNIPAIEHFFAAVQEASDGSLLAFGDSSTTTRGFGAVYKFDSSGDFLWGKNFDNMERGIRGVVLDDDTIVIEGMNSSYTNAILMKLNSTADSTEWVRVFDTPNLEFGNLINFMKTSSGFGLTAASNNGVVVGKLKENGTCIEECNLYNGTFTPAITPISLTISTETITPVSASHSVTTLDEISDFTWDEVRYLCQAPLYPAISVDPTLYDFGEVNTGEISTSQSFTISNTGNADLEIQAITVTGADASEFSIQNDTCSNQTLTASGTCILEVVFSPTTEGVKSATLSIPSNDPDMPSLEVFLEGIGNVPSANIPVVPPGGSYVISLEGLDFTFTSNQQAGTLSVIYYPGSPPNPGNVIFLNGYWDITASMPNGTFSAEVTFPYTDEHVSEAGLSEQDLNVFYSDDGGQTWLEATRIGGDPVANTITIQTDHFSLWAIGAVVTTNQPPTISLLEPDGVDDSAETSFTITWTDDDPDNDAGISLYYDTDNSGEDGTLIVDELNEDDETDQHLWDTTNIADGTYYVYAVIDDGVNAPVVAYSDGPVTIVTLPPEPTPTPSQNPIPEPTTFFLVGLGLFGLFALGLRMRRTKK